MGSQSDYTFYGDQHRPVLSEHQWVESAGGSTSGIPRSGQTRWGTFHRPLLGSLTMYGGTTRRHVVDETDIAWNGDRTGYCGHDAGGPGGHLW
jgi:hypothetical protein